MAEEGGNPAPAAIRFRSGKKRKNYRQRDVGKEGEREDGPARSSEQSPVEEGGPEGGDGKLDEVEAEAKEEEGENEAVAAALRLRSLRRAGRLRGVGFKSENQVGQNAEQALVKVDGDNSADAENTIAGMDSRFMHQTGLLTILDDVHMNEYIEARLASRKAARGSASPSTFSKADDDDDDDDKNNKDNNNGNASSAGATAYQSLSRAKDHQPARQGKLFEVSIPEDVRRQDDGSKRRRVEKADKPRGKGGNRRNSDDVERDNLVEQFLHENRLDVYDAPEESTSRYAPGKDYSADARLAEQFRRQYYEDLALRRKKRRPAQQGSGSGFGSGSGSGSQRQQQSSSSAFASASAGGSEVLRGPKLGGSRNQRAAIRNILLQQQETKREK